MSYYSDLIEQIKDEVKKNTYPPVFEKKIFDFSVRNCYAYALNLNVSDRMQRVLYPGCISSENEKTDIYSEKMLLERLEKDLEFLGFTFRPNDKNLEESEYRIAIYAFPSFHDMHFSWRRHLWRSAVRPHRFRLPESNSGTPHGTLRERL